jgi:hypothetical protein
VLLFAPSISPIALGIEAAHVVQGAKVQVVMHGGYVIFHAIERTMGLMD